METNDVIRNLDSIIITQLAYFYKVEAHKTFLSLKWSNSSIQLVKGCIQVHVELEGISAVIAYYY